jgi:hypothetical protein
MNRRNFIYIAGGAVLLTGAGYYLSSDKTNFTRDDMKPDPAEKFSFKPNEKEILYLASLAPSGHNTQPWFVKYIEPYHWMIGNDKSKWLPAVDPAQRETMLSLGAFLQNLEYASASLGYDCQFNLQANTNQDENIMEVKLTRSSSPSKYDIQKIKQRRTIRSDYMSEVLKKEDAEYLIKEESGYMNYLPNASKESLWLNENTIEANRIQSYRDAAQSELADWIRFSNSDARKYCDGLTPAGMEINGIPGWIVRNFYGKEDVMKNSFREEGIDKVKEQVSHSGGWILITSKDNSAETLIETGKRFQRTLLKIRKRGIAIHPMTQILEEPQTKQTLNSSIGISDNVQFILRTGHIKKYPDPVSLRRPVESFLRT